VIHRFHTLSKSLERERRAGPSRSIRWCPAWQHSLFRLCNCGPSALTSIASASELMRVAGNSTGATVVANTLAAVGGIHAYQDACRATGEANTSAAAPLAHARFGTHSTRCTANEANSQGWCG